MDRLHGPRGLLSFFAIAIVAALAATAIASDEGAAAADEVSQAIYYDLMDNWLFTHTGDNRGPNGPDLVPARDNIAALMTSYGLTVTLEPFQYSSKTYHNVVGTKLGTLYPDQEYVIGAHYDSVSNPGADDNASGTALVLEAARIISQYDSDYTIRFVAFSMEEVGLVGSEAYVNAHYGDDIIAMISADMVAYDPSTNRARVYGRTASPVKDDLGAAIIEYGDGLTWIDSGWISASDHAPFDSAGFDACLLIEAEVWNNPYYHTQDDNFENPNNLNFEFAVKMTRSAVGYLVDNAVVHVPVDTLSFTYPNGQPEYVDPAGGTLMRVEVTGVGSAVPQPGTGVLHYDIGSGWQTVAMDVITDNVYDAVFPSANCPDDVYYYVSAEAVGGQVYTNPRNAPATTYSAIAAYGVTVSLQDDFETDTGWTVEAGADYGDWERAVPAGSGGDRGDPPTDYDGSGRCYVTGNGVDEDVDGGPTRLTSPTLDLSDGADYWVSYAQWFYNDDGDDVLLVEVSNGGGWQTVESVSATSGWEVAGFRVAGYVTLTDQIVVRFTTDDSPNDSVTEAGIDAFQVYAYVCEPEYAKGDMNCDGSINGFDIDPFVLVIASEPPYSDYYAQFPDCDHMLADINNDGQVNGFDIDPFVALLGG
ncbi:MAG: M28 family peptidase [Planctomycetes bacterium]|nr:M28 family peptidase [Planctomycetota bacterium]